MDGHSHLKANIVKHMAREFLAISWYAAPDRIAAKTSLTAFLKLRDITGFSMEKPISLCMFETYFYLYQPVSNFWYVIILYVYVLFAHKISSRSSNDVAKMLEDPIHLRDG